MKSSVVRLAMAGVCALTCVAIPDRAESGSITFEFDRQIASSPPFGLTSGHFGTLTLTDSLLDSNRVDFNLSLTPAFGATLEKVYLNWVGDRPTQSKFFLVDQNAAAGSQTPIPGGANVALTNSNLQFGGFMFDISLADGPWPLNFSGSLAFFNTLGTPDTPVDIDVADFFALSAGDRTPDFYAGYRTNVLGGGVGEFWAGATTVVDVHLPEPASMLLLGSGLFGLAGYRRRRMR